MRILVNNLPIHNILLQQKSMFDFFFERLTENFSLNSLHLRIHSLIDFISQLWRSHVTMKIFISVEKGFCR